MIPLYFWGFNLDSGAEMGGDITKTWAKFGPGTGFSHFSVKCRPREGYGKSEPLPVWQGM